MKFEPTPIAGVEVITPQPHGDQRGFFERRFCSREFQAAGLPVHIHQINRSLSAFLGTVRGLHFQIPPMSELKIVQCFRGGVFDVAVDLRKDSPTYLQWHAEVLDEKNGKALVIPHGCAHGFQALSDNTEVIYFTDQFYSPVHERTLNHADSIIGIPWPLDITVVSEKDKAAPFFGELNY